MSRGKWRGTVSLDYEDASYEVEVRYSWDSGRLYGPPEDCYPPESELEAISARRDGKPMSQEDLDDLMLDEGFYVDLEGKTSEAMNGQ